MSRSEANPLDVESIDAIISAAYDSISGPPGKRDWNRERSLFIPGARLIPMAENAGETSPGGEITPHMLDIDGFIARVGDYLILRARNCAAHGTIRAYRARLEHVRIALHRRRSGTVHARDQQHSAILRRHSLVDRDHLLAARKYRASNSGKIFVGKHTLNAQFRRESALSDGCGRQMHLLPSRTCRE